MNYSLFDISDIGPFLLQLVRNQNFFKLTIFLLNFLYFKL